LDKEAVMQQQQDPNQLLRIPRWKWEQYILYILAADELVVAVENAHDRHELPFSLEPTFSRVIDVVGDLDLDQAPTGREGPGDNHQSEELPDQSDPETKGLGQADYGAQMAVAAKRYWCCNPSQGASRNYYGTKTGAYAYCDQLSGLGNYSCSVTAGKC
jgi:hypothetical protein